MVSHDKLIANIPAVVCSIPCGAETQSGSPGAPSDSASLPSSRREKSVESLDGATKGEMVGNVASYMQVLLLIFCIQSVIHTSYHL